MPPPGYKAGGKKCRKNLQAVTKERSEAVTLRMLKAWGAWGADVATRKEYAAVWSTVVAAMKDGTLPDDIPEVKGITKKASRTRKATSAPPRKRACRR